MELVGVMEVGKVVMNLMWAEGVEGEADWLEGVDPA